MLFCKPARKKELYLSNSPSTQCRIYFRSPELKRDIPFLQLWGNISMEILQDFSKNQDRHLFIGMAGHKRICLIELYCAEIHPLGKHIDVHPDDCCMQILINPFFEPASDMTKNVLPSFLPYYFSFPQAKCLYAIAEIHQYKNCRILEQSGFIFQQNIILPSIAASLYLIT